MRAALDVRVATDHFPGIGRVASSLAHALAAQLKPEDSLVLITNPGRPSRWTLPQPSANIHIVQTHATPFSLAQQWVIPRILRQERVDCYHSLYSLMPYLPGVPTLVTVHDLIPMRFPGAVSLRARILFQLTTRLACRSAQHLASVSDATRDGFIHAMGVSPETISTIRLAADPIFKVQPDTEIARVREKYALPGKLVLYVGSNKPHKNLPRLVKAWEQCTWAKAHAGTVLCLAGAWDARYPETAIAVANNPASRSIQILGAIPDEDLPGLYGSAAVFVFPSLAEGFGLPVLEAMACSVPVVCSDRDSLPEVTGGAALLVDPLSTQGIRIGIQTVLDKQDLSANMQRRGLTQAAEFSWAHTAMAYWDQYLALQQGK